MSFVVELSPTAEADLERLFEFLLDQADTTEDLDRAQSAIDALRAPEQHRLAVTPFTLGKAAQNPAQRELIIPFGATGYVALLDRQHAKSRRVGGAPFQRAQAVAAGGPA